MKINTISESRTSIALTKETIAKIKSFCNDNDLRMYEMVECLADIMLESDTLKDQVIALTKERATQRMSGRAIFSKRVAALPKPLQQKLKSMSPKQLQALLERAEA